jgi:hypothetical protein
MEQSERPEEKAAIAEIDALIKRGIKTWTQSKKARQEWDFKTFDQTLTSLSEILDLLTGSWQAQHSILQQAVATEQDWVNSEDYPAQVEDALRSAGIPYKGEFPTYEFPPFKLGFARDSGVVRLSIGRRSQQTKAFAPEVLVPWVVKQYQRVINSKFDASRFCKELLSAYEILNPLSHKGESVVWGHPVPLKDIYTLLTLRQSTRQDYPEPIFIYDLTRLKEQVAIDYDGYRFELMPSRQQSKTYLLVNSQGQESRVSTLTVYESDQS